MKRRAIHFGAFTLTAIGIACLGYCAMVWADAGMYQWRQAQVFEHALRARRVAPPLYPVRRAAAILPEGSLIGRLEIPQIHVSVMVVEGADGKDLRRAAGHIPGTALPGAGGNVGIAGHRDTFFRPLAGIRRNDTIVLRTLAGTYRYRVVSMNVVAPGDVGVLRPTARSVLTLVTCFPFHYVGPAPKRFVVRAVALSAPAPVRTPA